jgi:phage tail-like protein
VRGAIPQLPTPHPLLNQLPALYLEHDFLGRFLSALDEVLAPVHLTLDNMPAHLHPATAPQDFLAWMAGWVAAEVEEGRPEAQQRSVVAGALARHRQRGTRQGLAEAVFLETGVQPEIVDSGGTAWSTVSGAPLPGSARASVTIRLRVADPGQVDRTRLEKLVAGEVPAHVVHRIEILSTTEEARAS